MNENINKIKCILENIGVYCNEIDENTVLHEFIEDSITFVSFFVEIESEYNIEIPDQFYTKDVMSYPIIKLVEIIEKCKGGEDIDQII